jgi:hypothetical protein
VEKHKIHQIDLQTARIYRKGEAAKAAPSFPFDSIDTISFSTMMKRE